MELFWRQCWEQEAFSVQLFQARMRFLLLLCQVRELLRYRPKLPTALADPAVRKMTLTGLCSLRISLVLDEADLLTDEEESQLLDKLEAITGEYNLEVAVATVESKDGNEMNYFTDHFFDENGYGTGENHDGILFMVSIGDREWHITTHGYGMTAFNDDGLAYLKENVEPLLKDENFYGAFDTYADLCQDLLEMAANGEPYTEPFSPIWILISLGIGLVLAFLCTMGMRAQLKSVRTQDSAVDYVRQGSMALTRSNDIFLYHTVTKTAKPKDSDSSSGGSDSDHGGTGGSF